MPVQTTPFKFFEPFEVNDKNVVQKRSLRFDVNALADFEQETGMGFGQLMSTRAVFATARALLWAGLKHEDRTLTIPRVGVLISRWLQSNRKNSIDQLLTAAFEAAKDQGAFGDMDDEEEGASNQGNDAPQDKTPTTP